MSLRGSRIIPPQSTIADLTDSMGDSTTDETLEAIGDTSTANQAAPIERNLAELNEKIQAIVDALESAGVLI